MAALCLLLALGGCRDDAQHASDKQSAAAVADIESAGKDLVSRRDELLETRRKLALRRAELDAKREKIAAAGGDTEAIDQEFDELASKEHRISEELVSVSGDLVEALKRQRSSLAQMAGGNSDKVLAVRESALVSREESVAHRESDLARREKELAKRESEMAQRWKESCAVGGTTIIQPPKAAGAHYRRRDVEKSLRRARDLMRKRGILSADLPSPLRSLDRAARKAMKSGDYGEAYFAADQLARGVKSLSVDRAFVRAKFDRVSAQVKGSVSDDVARLLSKITSDFGEGRYAAANRKLNDLISRL